MREKPISRYLQNVLDALPSAFAQLVFLSSLRDPYTGRYLHEGWASVFERWLEVSRLRAADTLLVFSVGGGNLEKNVSPNLVAALRYAKSIGAGILGIVGRDGGYTATVADACVIVPTVNSVHTTPHAEAFQAVVWHLLVSHPAVKRAETKWESVR